jgi:DNA-binding NarL/FixJ family response regulator
VTAGGDRGARGQSIRVLLVDDHALVRDGLRALIDQEPDLVVCGTASSGAEALQALEASGPDLIILDLSLGDVDGTRLIRLLLERSPKVHILVLSVYEEEVYAERCLRAGARGYLNKRAAGEEVRSAIRVVAGGGLYRSDEAQARCAVVPARSRRDESLEDGPEALSDRELEPSASRRSKATRRGSRASSGSRPSTSCIASPPDGPAATTGEATPSAGLDLDAAPRWRSARLAASS